MPPDLQEQAPYGFNNGLDNGFESGTAAASGDPHALEVSICQEEQEQTDTKPDRLPAVQPDLLIQDDVHNVILKTTDLEILDAELVGPKIPVDYDDNEPALGCPDHPDNAIPKCGSCMRARKKHERWVAGGGYSRQLSRDVELLGGLSSQRPTAQTCNGYSCQTCCDTGYVHRGAQLGDLPSVLALCLICGRHPASLNPRGNRYVITAEDMPDHRDAIEQLKAQHASRGELTA